MTATHRFTAALLGLLLTACASDPPRLVALPAPETATAPGPDRNAGATLLVRKVTLPKYLDSFAVVVDRNANTLVVSGDAEWAEGLRDAVTRSLRDELSLRLGASRVLVRGERRIADAELVIEFSRLDPSDGTLQLDASWSFVCNSRVLPAHASRTRLQVPLEATTPSAVASSTVNALHDFAAVLASETWCAGDSAARQR
jgi:uncharacterized lipoprotein YmbA